MHKLLKAKQDLIEIQKKRIEYLTNRNSGPSTSSSTSTLSSLLTPTTTQPSSNPNKPNQTNQSNYSTLNYNQYAHQPKIRHQNRAQANKNASNPSINLSADFSIQSNPLAPTQSNLLPTSTKLAAENKCTICTCRALDIHCNTC